MKKWGICLFLFVLGTSLFAQYNNRNSGGGGYVGIIIGVIIGVIVLFFICRELICWYYKINEIIVLLGEQNRLLGELSRNIGSLGNVQNSSGTNSSGSNPAPIRAPIINYGDTWICKKCGEKSPNSSLYCKECGAYK